MRKLKVALSVIFLIIMFLLGGCFVVLFAGHDGNKKIITTNFAIYDMCREIMGDGEDILLLGGGVDMHGYQPTAHDVIKVANCDVFIRIGGENDKWVEDVIESSGNENVAVLTLSEEVEVICNHEHDHEDDHHHHEFDEHIWLSIKNMITLADSVYETLSSVYPENEEVYFINKNKYVSKLMAIDKEYSDTFTSSPTIVIADRFPFTYLFNDYNIDYYSLFEGCSAESEASPETITSFIDVINDLKVNYIYNLETSTTTNAKRIVGSSDCKGGVEILTLNSIQSIKRDMIETTTYIDIMKDNLEVLRKAIK